MPLSSRDKNLKGFGTLHKKILNAIHLTIFVLLMCAMLPYCFSHIFHDMFRGAQEKESI